MLVGTSFLCAPKKMRWWKLCSWKFPAATANLIVLTSLFLSTPKIKRAKTFFHIVEENITKLSKMKSQQRNEGLWERREEISGVEANSNENCYNDLHNFSLKNITLCSSILFVIIFCFKFILSCFSILLSFLQLEQTGYDEKWEKCRTTQKQKNWSWSKFPYFMFFSAHNFFSHLQRILMQELTWEGKKVVRCEINKTISEHYAKLCLFFPRIPWKSFPSHSLGFHHLFHSTITQSRPTSFQSSTLSNSNCIRGNNRKQGGARWEEALKALGKLLVETIIKQRKGAERRKMSRARCK